MNRSNIVEACLAEWTRRLRFYPMESAWLPVQVRRTKEIAMSIKKTLVLALAFALGSSTFALARYGHRAGGVGLRAGPVGIHGAGYRAGFRGGYYGRPLLRGAAVGLGYGAYRGYGYGGYGGYGYGALQTAPVGLSSGYGGGYGDPSWYVREDSPAYANYSGYPSYETAPVGLYGGSGALQSAPVGLYGGGYATLQSAPVALESPGISTVGYDNYRNWRQACCF
jgi:hypothetical protein